MPVRFFAARDGIRLAYREVGTGRPVVLLHGYTSTAVASWVEPGHAAVVAAAGHRVILPDLRGHGDSAAPHDPAAYPPDVLADDGLALVDHLGLGPGEFDLGGYSLGARTTVRMLARGAAPGRAVVAGLGLEAITRSGPSTTASYFRRVLTATPGGFRPGSPEDGLDRLLTRLGADREALLRVLALRAGTSADELARMPLPVLVVTGTGDPQHCTAGALADALPAGRAVAIPGDHPGAISAPRRLGTEIAAFLAE